MCFTEGDPPEFAESSMPIARKEHRCCECLVVIGRGERYERVVGKWEGDLLTFTTCQRCYEKRQEVVAEELARGCHYAESVPAFGYLWEEVHEMERYG